MVPFPAERLLRAARTRVHLAANSIPCRWGRERQPVFRPLRGNAAKEQAGELVPRHLLSPHGGLSTFGDLERGVPRHRAIDPARERTLVAEAREGAGAPSHKDFLRRRTPRRVERAYDPRCPPLGHQVGYEPGWRVLGHAHDCSWATPVKGRPSQAIPRDPLRSPGVPFQPDESAAITTR